MQTDLLVLESPEQAAAVLDPVRSRLLEHLREPDSAAGAARALKLPRQRLGYHVRELERAGLIRAVGERKQRNCVERLLQATARRYVISPSVGQLSSIDIRDRFSSEYLVATAARVVQDVGTLQRLARDAGKKLPTLTIESEVRFASPEASHAFTRDLARAVAALVAEYHDETAQHGRRFRVVAAAHPALPSNVSPRERSD
ncbi:MAG: transcriptional regulator, ArsR family [Gemmatimonadetes bacterium]|nr:transcriptional regulator, ArsR family [Gemmatimonadota bacterium]